MVLAELAGRIAQRLQEFGDSGVLRLQADRCGRNADLGQAGAEAALPGDEGGTARGAGLLAVGVGKAHPLLRDAINIGGAVAHQSVAITAEVGDADIVPPDDENVRLPRSWVCHWTLLRIGSCCHPSLEA